MNRLVKAIVFSVSAALVTTSAFAGPQQSNQPQHQAPTYQQKGQAQFNQKGPQHVPKHQQNAKFDDKKSSHQQSRTDQQKYAQKHDIKQKNDQHRKDQPTRDWRVGQKLPSKYQGNSYHVDHKQSYKLSKPAKNQQWVKVNGDYILTNILTHAIIKIIAG